MDRIIYNKAMQQAKRIPNIRRRATKREAIRMLLRTLREGLLHA